MSFANLGFETVGTAGVPASWTRTSQGSLVEYAAFLAGAVVWESFNAGWDSNESYVLSLGLGNTTVAEYATTLYTQKFVENFEEKWDTNEAYAFGLSSISTASYTSGAGTNTFENFEKSWDSNESFLYEFVGIGVDLTAGVFDTSPEAYEDFEESWGAFVTDIGAGSTAIYQVSSSAYEDFEDSWSDSVMTSV